MTHQYAQELLTHILCARCQKPWTLSDIDRPEERTWACPHCEFVAGLVPMAPLEPPSRS